LTKGAGSVSELVVGHVVEPQGAIAMLLVEISIKKYSDLKPICIKKVNHLMNDASLLNNNIYT
jgi:hypothetical protein